ncbi:MAG: substrate-binding domain-containing protein [Clostridiales bacterium]|nr:substrate-binding domain-containing protein [Clostridiales bacterium]
MKTKMMKKISILIAVILALAILAGCEQAPAQQSGGGEGGSQVGAIGGSDRSDQEYIWISQYSSLPMFVERVYPTLEAFGRDYGVTVRVAGPTGIDLAAYIATVEQETAGNPAGIIVVGGWDPALSEPVAKAIAAKVPVVVTDGDMLLSGRLCYVGTDSYQSGVKFAEAQMAEHKARGLNGGKVAIIMPLVMENMQLMRDGIHDTFAGTDFEVVAIEENDSSPEIAAQKVAGLLSAYRDLTGIIGLDSESGPGIVAALDEAGVSGPGGIIVVCNEADIGFLENIRNGKVTMMTVERYDVMNYVALQLLYTWHNQSIAHGDLDIWENNWMPDTIDSGVMQVTKENVDEVESWLLSTVE